VISPKELLACGSSVRLEGVATVVRESGTRTLSFLSALPYEKALEKLGAALAEAARPVATVPPPDGEVDVVLSPSAAAVFWHEAVGHPLEADGGELVSVLARVPEAVVAPPGVDVIDDPGRRDLPGAYLVDDEGTPARRVPLIVDGCVRGLLTDRRSSGANANGHGRTPDYRRPVRARMSNLVVLAGRASMEDLLANLGTGLLVHEVSAGSADPESGRFVLLVERAQQVRRGKPGAFVAPFALAGEILGALSRLDPELGDLAEPAQGLAVCAKGGDPVPVGGSSPAILLRSRRAVGARERGPLRGDVRHLVSGGARGPGHGA
jgi:TldD protein